MTLTHSLNTVFFVFFVLFCVFFIFGAFLLRNQTLMGCICTQNTAEFCRWRFFVYTTSKYEINFGQLLHRQWPEFKGTVLDNSKKDSPLLELLKSVFSMKIFISGKSKIITTRLNLTPWQRHLYKFISGFIQ